MELISFINEDYSIFVCLDSIKLGPALGGCRIWKYDTDEEAKEDCLRLAKGMTYKNSLCGLDYGGAKAVLNLRNPEAREAALDDVARLVDFYDGDYITAEDVGVTKEDLTYLRSITDNIASRSKYDASAMTAYGVYQSMKACMYYKHKTSSLEGKIIAIQGAGKVGAVLADHCAKEGATVYISDLYKEKAVAVAKQHIIAVPNDTIHTLEVDIYAPCALGGILNPETIPELNCQIVCGCANNQLSITPMATMLKNRGIIYAPDYLVNAGGVLTILVERHEMYKTLEDLLERIAKLYDTTLECLELSEKIEKSTALVADTMAEKRLNG
jgi:leucine dehydrogenase